MTRAKIISTSRISSRTGRDRSVGLCGFSGLSDSYEPRFSRNGVRFKMNLTASVDGDEFS